MNSWSDLAAVDGITPQTDPTANVESPSLIKKTTQITLVCPALLFCECPVFASVSSFPRPFPASEKIAPSHGNNGAIPSPSHVGHRKHRILHAVGPIPDL